MKVSDKLARNLLSQLLVKDPKKRAIHMLQALHHPFISGKKVARMVGQTAEFDVFISYRVASDALHAELLFDLLTEAGIKVWWDKKCLASSICIFIFILKYLFKLVVNNIIMIPII